MDQITITVLIKDIQFKGILGPNISFPNSHWWDNELQVSVPKEDWDAEKITVGTIKNYIR